MYSSARKLSTISFILSVISIVGFILVLLLLIGANLEFYVFFSVVMFMISITAICLLLTISIRSIMQDMQMDYDSNAAQVKKLSERITELERTLK